MLKSLEAMRDRFGEKLGKRVVAARRIFQLRRFEVLARRAEYDNASVTDIEAGLAAYDERFRMIRDIRIGYMPRTDTTLDPKNALIRRSDDLVQRLIDPAYVDAVPSRDMLTTVERTRWGGSKLGVRSEWTHDALIVAHLPPEDNRKVSGVYSLDGWTVEWSDYAFDLEFTILAGGFDLFLRYRPDGYLYYPMSFKDGQGGYEKDQTYRMTIKVIGSTVTLEMVDQPIASDQISAKFSRTGGIGIGVGPGSKVAIKALKLKVLRPREK